MLDMAEKLSEAGLVPDRPKKTTFPDGRMATKEAWNYCTEICKKRKIGAPTLRTFKWHLKHGNLIEAVLVPNPFGGAGPDKVYAITCEAVVAFVSELEKRPGELEVGDLPSKKDVQRRGLKGTAPPTPTPSKKTAVEDNRELRTNAAFAYLHRNISVRSDLNFTTFGFYLIYDVISSRLEKDERFVKVGDLDAFLELAPDGVYANHIDYLVAPSRGPGDLSLKDAYDYYRDIDPVPISLTSFRSVVASGIIPAIRTSNNPKAMVVGFRRQDLNGFLATRQRLQEASERRRKEEKDSAARTTLVATVMQDALSKSGLGRSPVATLVDTREAPEPPKKKATKKVATAKAPAAVPAEPKPAKTPEPRWAPTKKAYAYYQERAQRAFTESWFRDKVYRSKLFRTKTEADDRPNSLSDKKCYVDLDSVDEYLAQDPKTKPTPQKAWPVEKAYHKFEELIPAGLSMLQFKQLVNTGLIRSFTRASVVHVRLDAVESYFGNLVEKDPEQILQTGPAYNYYCSRCTDPAQKAQFSRWITNGEIEGAVKNEDGVWTITVGHLDEFLEEYPKGRKQAVGRSRTPAKPRTPKPKKEGPSKAAPSLPEVSETKIGVSAPGSLGTVSVSLRDYPSAADMKAAIGILQNQGFDVQVKP